MDYSKLSVSNGSGDAALMHITAVRLTGATTISVDSVVNVPAKFIGTYGTPASDVLINPATKVDFLGHLSGSDLIIDSFLDGGIDVGNVEGQIVVIKPNSPHTNAMVALAKVAHNDDGTLKTAILAGIWPVGSVYMNTQVTNPATLLGFGTWVAFAAGKMPVGYLAGDPDFGTGGATGGSKTHFHWQTFGSDNNNAFGEIQGAGSGHTSVVSVNRTVVTTSSPEVNASRRDGTYDSSSLPPFVAVYMWTRTA